MRRNRSATSKPASPGCGWPPSIITTRTTAVSPWRAWPGSAAAPSRPTLRREAVPRPASGAHSADRIALLLATGLNREAMGELQYAQRMWGDSPRLQATIALTHRRLGNIRAGINAMKRAYPQYLAAGGETLPREILQVIFPVEYWPLLQKYAAAHGLDPYLVAALVAQESNFDPVVKSPANAVRLDAGAADHRPRLRAQAGHPAVLGQAASPTPETNVRIGTQIFADTIKKFGGVHFALAAYNAGDSRVVRLAARAARPAAGRVHRRHPVPRDAELRQAHSRHRRRLPTALRTQEVGSSRGFHT